MQRNQRPDVLRQVNNQGLEQIQQNRHALSQIIRTIPFCSRQNIALRGHEEGKENFMALLTDRAENDPILADHLYNPNRSTKYASSEIQNELLDVCAAHLKAAITERCNNAGFWSFIADEASDLSCRELNIRFVEQGADHTTMVQEEILGFVRAHSTTGEALPETFLESLTSLGLDLTQLRSQGYDGAANMSGHHRGVQARIARLVPEAHYVHCHVHVLNLVIAHNCKLPIVRNMMYKGLALRLAILPKSLKLSILPAGS